MPFSALETLQCLNTLHIVYTSMAMLYTIGQDNIKCHCTNLVLLITATLPKESYRQEDPTRLYTCNVQETIQITDLL